MKKWLCLLSLLFPLMTLACTHDHVKYTNGYVRATPPGHPVTAAYMDIENTGDQPIVIESVSSPDATDVMLHQNIEHQGKVRMVHLHELVIPPHETVTLAPGGHHIMLTPKKPLVEGDTITLTFLYSDGSSSKIRQIPVKSGQ